MPLKLAILEFLGRTVYHEPEPQPRVREKPMEVLCVGFPRSATESLQVALLKLGYDYTYHGWDILFEDPHRMEAWARLTNKKFHGAQDGESNLTRADFDAIIGHSVAITDAPAALFAAEMIEAYPEAKVILNVRRDLDAWHRSADNALCQAVNDNWMVYISSLLTSNGFWSWHLSQRLINPLLFRASDDGERAMARAIRQNGKWVYREHCYMIRGMVAPERLLEWDVEDGWEPLCKFLGKKVPDEEFPRTNNPAGFERRVGEWFAANQAKAKRNLLILGAVAVAMTALVSWRIAPGGTERMLMSVRKTLRVGRS